MWEASEVAANNASEGREPQNHERAKLLSRKRSHQDRGLRRGGVASRSVIQIAPQRTQHMVQG